MAIARVACDAIRSPSSGRRLRRSWSHQVCGRVLCPERSHHIPLHRPSGFLGTHTFSVTPGVGGTVLSHTLSMQALGRGALSWALVFRPLHDALLEDALTKAEQSLTGRGTPIAWSVYVRILRFFLRRRSKRGAPPGREPAGIPLPSPSRRRGGVRPTGAPGPSRHPRRR